MAKAKFIFKSKEIWLSILMVGIFGSYFAGFDPEGMLQTAMDGYTLSYPVLMAIVRIFFTKEPLTLSIR